MEKRYHPSDDRWRTTRKKGWTPSREKRRQISNSLSINSAENQLRYPRVNLAAKLPSWLDEQQAAPLPEPNSQPGRYNPSFSPSPPPLSPSLWKVNSRQIKSNPTSKRSKPVQSSFATFTVFSWPWCSINIRTTFCQTLDRSHVSRDSFSKWCNFYRNHKLSVVKRCVKFFTTEYKLHWALYIYILPFLPDVPSTFGRGASRAGGKKKRKNKQINPFQVTRFQRKINLSQTRRFPSLQSSNCEK